MKNLNDGRVTHGMYGTRIYRIWNAMRNRCSNENYQEFHLYGGRGISFISEWNTFEGFYKWASENGYEEDLTLDRIDTDGMYEPTNCKWSTQKEQANNRRSNVLVEYKGEIKNVKEWSEALNMSYKSLWKRINKGWSTERAFNTPMKKHVPTT